MQIKEIIGAERPLRRWKPADMNRPLVRISSCRGDVLDLSDACTGLLLLGETGSGKTSSAKTLFDALMRYNDPSGLSMGGLGLCVKADEPQELFDMMVAAGRGDDVVMIGRGEGEHRLNIFDVELNQGSMKSGDATERLENIVITIMDAAAVIQQKNGTAANDDTWIRAAKQLLRSLLTIVYLGRGKLDIGEIYSAMSSLPASHQQAQEEVWRKESEFWHMVIEAQTRTAGAGHVNFDASLEYCLLEYPSLAVETRSSVNFTLSALLDVMRRDPVRDILFSETDVRPETMRTGKFFIVNLPVKTWNEIGQIAQVLIKRTFQRVAERVIGSGAPVLFWIDEFQNFVNQADADFQATARSCRVISVYMSQNRPLLISRLGNKEGMDALLSNLTTKLFFLNSDNDTNEWAANLIGKAKRKFRSTNSGSSFGGGQFSQNNGSSYSEQMDHLVRATRFQTLKNGGAKNKFRVEAYVYKTGRTWGRERKPYSRVVFEQRTLGEMSTPLRMFNKLLGGDDFVRAA